MSTLTLKTYKGLFNDYYKALCLFADKYLDNIDLSKDIVQDVFVKIWEDDIVFRREQNIKSYLYTMVKNKSLDYLKSKEVRVTDRLQKGTVEDLQEESFFLREVVVIEASDIIDKAIESLPKKCSQIIRLSIQSYTNAEIAEILNISVNTIKTQKKIAYKKLRPILKEHFVLISFIFVLN